VAHASLLSSPAWARDWRAAFRARDSAAAVSKRATWRDDAQQLALIVGAAAANFIPSAWVVVGSLSRDLLQFGIRIVVIWTVCTALQLATLRWLRQAHWAVLRRCFTQWAILAAGGVMLHVTVSHIAVAIGGEYLSLEDGGWWNGAIGAWSSLLAALYLVWQREASDLARSAAQRLQSIKNTQLAARRTLVEQELVAAQAQIDPKLFFDTLDSIETLYGSEPARAETLLDELIAFLRAALPHHDEACSTLADEIELAAAFVRMHAMARGLNVSLASEVDGALLHATMTPGLLLPLLRGVLDTCRGPAMLQLVAHLPESGVLELRLETPSLADDATLKKVGAALHAVHGAAASLLRLAGAIHMRLPYVAG
jgi:hypothetical protein